MSLTIEIRTHNYYGYRSEDDTLALGCLLWWRFEGCHDSLQIAVLVFATSFKWNW